jgi:hypothetical protein
MSFAAVVTADRRRDILRLLMQAPPHFQANARVIHRGLVADSLFPPSLDQVNGDIAWLAEQLLIKTETLRVGDQSVLLATLLQRGKDVAQGFAIVPGVAEPEPAA